MKKTPYIKLFLFFALVVVIATACNNNENNEKKYSGNAEIKFEHTQADLGKLQEGEQVEHAFYFTNTGSNILQIKEIITDCGCTVASIEKKEYKPNEEGVIRIRLNTSQLFNNQYKTTKVITNTKDSVITLSLAAFIESEYELVPVN